MKTFIALIVFLPLFAQAKWTAEEPVKATVWSFDKKCVKLKLPDGTMLDVKKESLQLKKIESRVTTVEIHPKSASQAQCI